METRGKTLRAVIYCRVSSERQADEGTSLPEQLDACRMKAEQIGAAVVAEHNDPGVSGAFYLARPGIQAALSELESGVANVLIIYNLSRYSRDREHQAAIKKRVEAAGARLVFTDMTFDDTPAGEFAFNVMGDYYHFERQIIRDRTMKGRRRRAADEGLQTARAMHPYGYHVVTKGDVLAGTYPPGLLGTYQVIDSEAGVITELFRRYASGDSLATLAVWLNDSGIETPRRGAYWRRSTLKRIIENPVYKGTPVFGRHERRTDEKRLEEGFKPYTIRRTAEDRWIYLEAEPITDEETWTRCQERLSEGRSVYGGNPERKHMLTGLLCCPLCRRGMRANRRMTRRSGSDRMQLRHTYHCPDQRASRNAAGQVCNTKEYWGPKAERIVIDAIIGFVSNPQAMESAIAAYKSRQRAEFEPAEYERVRAELSGLDARESAAVDAQLDALTKGRSAEPYEKALNAITARRKTLQARLEALEAAQGIQVKKDAKLDGRAIFAELLEKTNRILRSESVAAAVKHDLLATLVNDILPEGEGYAINLKPFRWNGETVANIKTL